MSEHHQSDPLTLSAAARLPYSKGLMAKTLMSTGLTAERSYELARLIETELPQGDAAVSIEPLLETAFGVLAEHEGEDAVERLRRFQAFWELDRPLLLLVGGATGTGKSSVTTEVAQRLGIVRVASTDLVRQTMRAFFSREFMPSIHYSSFDAGAAVADAASEDAGADAEVLGFLEQTRNVLVGARALLERAVEEGYSLALEGVHLVPGLVPDALSRALVCQCVVAIESEEEHARHFWVRDATSGGLRPVEKYLRALPEIRRIQAHLVERAGRAGVPVIENSRFEEAVDAVLHLVLDRVEASRLPA